MAFCQKVHFFDNTPRVSIHTTVLEAWDNVHVLILTASVGLNGLLERLDVAGELSEFLLVGHQLSGALVGARSSPHPAPGARVHAAHRTWIACTHNNHTKTISYFIIPYH